MLLPGSLDVVSFDLIIKAIEVVACFDRCIFVPESAIAIMLLPGRLGGVLIHFIKLILGLLI